MRPHPPHGLLVVLAVGAAFALAVIAQAPGVNGPWYWEWPWVSLPFSRAFLLFAAPLALYAALVYRWSARPTPSAREAAAIVAGLVVCSVSLQLASVHVDERGFDVLVEVVRSSDITSYYTDAAKIRELGAWLSEFDRIELEHHSSTHPPGPVLYYYACILVFGEKLAPLAGGIGIGLLGSLGVWLIYHFAALWTPDRQARLGASFLYTLLPAAFLALPEFDQVYPLGSMALMLCWQRALERTAAAFWLGLALFVTSFMAYNFLVMGAPMVLMAALHLRRAGWQRDALRRAEIAAAVALGVAAACHFGLWIATSFHPIDSFTRSLVLQDRYALSLARPFHLCIVYDLYDFFLGGGMLTLPLVLLQLRRDSANRALTLACLSSILIIDLTGLLRCEAARVWLFLQPLVFVPAGLQLASWNLGARALVLGLEALIVIILRCKLAFFTI